ncbi:dTDP-4-dehydrorhamnose reductase [Sanguibacter sp. 4.1]|uniref:dTDP-4-dehydrorhamnose reductase n=1 Tax=Sanguibacter biliveldensis TaxID=3030830 RepID=A0AAF0Z5K3_9MICO|nr:dTDP-4-dehydrorhamnose reductase [Sanguibacter sp. 4.1]WPF83232.1 dTDP-4-dehydrorhamnose reductase [Sanguibacter sp. 4.1]
MRWLVVGANGMLGQDLVSALRERGHTVDGSDRDTLDITDLDSATRGLVGYDVVVNCAAWTAVDDAETQEAAAFTVNAVGPANLARAARAAGARLVQISTDYVFAGNATEPYAEDAPTAPKSAYGRTKGAGEWAVRAETDDYLVVRTAWLYGARGACFPKTMVKLLSGRDTLSVVDDQVGQPTWTVDLADLVIRLVEAKAPSGTYHGTSTGQTSWRGFAQAAVAAAGLDPDAILATTSADFVRPAPRPSYSVLGHDALTAIGVAPIGDWAERWAAAAPSVLEQV